MADSKYVQIRNAQIPFAVWYADLMTGIIRPEFDPEGTTPVLPREYDERKHRKEEYLTTSRNRKVLPLGWDALFHGRMTEIMSTLCWECGQLLPKR